MKKAIMIGAGQIGRGFIGMLLAQAGYHVLFADLNQSVIDDINTRKEYTVHLVDTECIDTRVTNISAMHSLDERLPDEYAGCDLICTSVGLTALPKIAPAIAAGITRRMERGIAGELNVIACENALRASTILKQEVYALLTEEAARYADRSIGFPDCAVDRIIPPTAGPLAAEVTVERYHEWDVERGGFQGAVPDIPGMNVVDDLAAYLERKLFTLNGPNAVTAYLGYLKGYRSINESLKDPAIYRVVDEMMAECAMMLEKRHGFSREEMDEYRKLLMQRFVNPYVIDECARVAREPIRKLSPNDRIIAPMRYARDYGMETPAYYTGIAAALLYDNPADEQSRELQRRIQADGVKRTLALVCGIPQDSAESEEIVKEYERLQKGV